MSAPPARRRPLLAATLCKPLRAAVVAAAVIGVAALVPTRAPAQVKPPLTPPVAVDAQYDSSHVYVDPDDFDRFVASLVATFGGKTSPQGVATVTPTPSKTKSQLVLTPEGTFSVFGYETPIPYPFGAERTGYLVTDLDAAVRAAAATGADVVVAPFNDPIGRDAIIQWPGGVYMQLYWHTTPPTYPALATVPENRVYVSRSKADAFIQGFVSFSHGTVVSDAARASAAEIGRPNDTYRRVRITSPFGKMTVIVTDGFLPYPYGRETTGFDVPDLPAALERAKSAGATVLVAPSTVDGRQAAMVQFPGGYIAEMHAVIAKPDQRLSALAP